MTDIANLLQRFPADCRPTRVEPLGSAGGLSGAQFWRLSAPRGMLVVRRWPPEHPTPDDLRFIHAVVQHASRRGMSILPQPIPAIDGATFLRHAGHLWELTPWLPGAADFERSPSIEKVRAAMTALAEFHIATRDFPEAGDPRVAGAAPAVTRRLARLRELQCSGIDILARAINDTTWPELAPLARRFVTALPHAVPAAIAQLAPLANVPLPRQPCIRDIWHKNVLFEGDRVTGIVDFGAMAVDTPATDVARLLGSLAETDEDRWRKGLAAYSAVRPLSSQESLAVFALDAAGTILAGCNWIRWIYVVGRQFEDQRTVLERFQRIAVRTVALSSST